MENTPQGFPLFTFLPAELRLEIWRISCHSRVVEVRYSSEEDRCLTTTKPPVILQVCRESRYEGSRLYIQAFGTKTHPQGTIHYSPALDILYIPRCGNMGYGDTARDFGQYVLDTVGHVQALAIDHVNPVIRRPWETYNKFCLMRTFPNLQEAFLILSSLSRPSTPSSQLSEDTINSENTDGQIEFVDPRGDPEAIMRLMENVRESFSYEVAQTQQTPSPLEKPDDEGDHGDGEEQCFWEPYLALVPKTKVRSRTTTTQDHSWSMQPTFVACV